MEVSLGSEVLKGNEDLRHPLDVFLHYLLKYLSRMTSLASSADTVK